MLLLWSAKLIALIYPDQLILSTKTTHVVVLSHGLGVLPTNNVSSYAMPLAVEQWIQIQYHGTHVIAK